MSKVLIIGGRGKTGSYLVSSLVRAGHEVVNVSRGKRDPVLPDEAWDQVRQLTLDRGAAGFEEQIAQAGADVVVDMICFRTEDMLRLIRALQGRVGHYLACGSAWMHGHSGAVPVREEEGRQPLEEYGWQKSEMDDEIGRLYREEGFPGTMVHPGHITCPHVVPVGPQGFHNLSSFEVLRAGQPLYLPNFGMETVHHVHAGDVAGVFFAAIQAGAPAYGQGFHAVSPRAVTLRGFAQEVALWYGREADLRFEPFDQWKTRFEAEDADDTWTHIQHSPSCSMEKARELLGFVPKYSSYDAVKECVASFGLL